MQREVSRLTPSDFEAVAAMRAAAFAMKNPICFRVCWQADARAASAKESVKVHESYAKDAPQKLTHCGVVRDANGTAIGAVQLQMPGDPLDRHLGGMASSFQLPGEVHVEWIGTAPAAQGQGVGSALLKWADETAKASGARFMSLEVMAGNPRARRLYERQGYAVTRNAHDDGKDPVDRLCTACLTPPFVFCCMGCRYCRVHYMEKQLS